MSARARSHVPPEGAEFLTVAQAATLMGVCSRTVREWVKSGKLRRYGERRLFRVRRDEVRAVLAPAQPQRQDDDEVAARAILRRVGGS